MAAPGPCHFFAKNIVKFNWSDASLIGAGACRIALHDSGWTPNITATGNEKLGDTTHELTTANGYTAGGFTVTLAAAADAANDGWKLSTANASWTASGAGITARYASLYYLGTLWTVVNPLILYCVLDSTPADSVTAAGNVLQLNCPADGWGKATSS